MNINELFPSRFLKSDDLQGKEITLKISEVQIENLYIPQANESRKKAILLFEGKQKGLILNKGNAMKIANIYGSDTRSWVGQLITILPKMERIKGNTQSVIRVK